MEIRIKSNAIEAVDFFNRLRRNQLPYAVSRTINALAEGARNKELSDLPAYFEVRTPWTQKKGGMPVIKSNKRQWPHVQAVIGVKSEVMAAAAIGKPRSGKMAVPISNAGGGQSARQILNPGKQTLPQSKWPSRIVKKKGKRGRGGKLKAFYINSGTRKMVAARSGGVLQFLYVFKGRVNIPKQWPVEANVGVYVSKHYSPLLKINLDKAVLDSKRI